MLHKTTPTPVCCSLRLRVCFFVLTVCVSPVACFCAATGGILLGLVVAAVVAATVLTSKAPGPETLQSVSSRGASWVLRAGVCVG